MSQALRQALYMARSALACASRECLTNPAASAVQLEPRALTRLLSFRGFRQQSWAAQSAAAAPTGQQQTAPPPPSPWTPTRELKKRKILPKRMQHLLTTLEAERESEMAAELRRPVFGPGDVIELRLSVPENKRRVTVFKGICIARRNRSVRTTFTLRNIYGASGGIERTFPLYSPHITEMKVLSSRKVRRAKLYYLRQRTAKELRT
ncbi:hypothetical protein CHLNCDRAFT_140511 [Chlorella variabilis]|uniref:Ribosomal protein L19 n=1 Tax=Chlorella variabilis TaxID=554065 RepID=E1Z5J7_CHLVA|nr:hypothetical protein CHLNCDRAFT_140511 [Chlorella variabilis]EFN58486.1 hypothetical protein CHLNCDRAFT_140511 [Chlorella variabilis]|eukprot:XP_005850588.1 hypothetical protein CHLNCDRAFT_140511 [Chlorella variabilis]